MADDKIKFELDLDSKDFLEQLLTAKSSISALGDSSNIEGLISGLTEVGAVTGVVALAFYSLKNTLETVFNAEDIKAVNQQFEILSANAGLSATALKQGLKDASGGLISDTDLLKSANKAIIEMGDSAGQLPQLMELARKSTAAFGGDLMTNFQNLQQAIAMGNERMLKHQGIIIDTEKAYKTYADSIGVSVDSLNQAGKSQSVLNAVIDQGNASFSGINVDVKEATNTWQQLKTTVDEIRETFVLTFEKTVGPTVKSVLKDFRDFAGIIKDEVFEAYGDGAEASEAKSRNLERSLTDLRARLYDLQEESKKGGFLTGLFGDSDAAIADTQKKIATAEKQLDEIHAKTQAQINESKQAEAANMKPGGSRPKVDYEKQKAEKARFEQEVLKLREDRLHQEMSMTQSMVEFEALSDEKILAEKEKLQAKLLQIDAEKGLSAAQKADLKVQAELSTDQKIEQIEFQAAKRREQQSQKDIERASTVEELNKARADRQVALEQELQLRIDAIRENDALTEEQKRLSIEQEEQEHTQRMIEIRAKFYQENDRMINNSVAKEQGAANQFAAGFASGSAKAGNSMSNFGAQGQAVFGMFGSHATQAFVQIGEGSKKGSEVMREQMFGLIADIAQYYGSMMLLTSLVPPNPLGIAGGAALLVLSGFLRSKAGGAASGGSVPSGVSGGVDTGSIGGSIGGGTSDVAQQAQKTAKSVTIQVQGSYYETEQTKTRLTEMVRDALDATDFQVKKIGA